MATRYDNLQKLKTALLRRPHTFVELKNHIAVSTRTLFRYLEKLEAEKPGLQKDNHSPVRYFLTPIEDSGTPVNQTKLDRLEKVSEELFAMGNIKHSKQIEEITHNLIHNSPNKKSQVLELNPHFHLDHGPLAENSPSKKRCNMLLSKIAQAKMVKLQYQGTNGPRSINFCPMRLILRVGTLYLIGTEDDPENNLRGLRFSRIESIQSLSKSFTPVDQKVLNEFYRFCFGQWKPADEETAPEKIRLKPKANWTRTLLKEAKFNPAAQESSKGVFELKLFHTPELENWLMGLLPSIEILGPKSLKEAIKNRLEESLKIL